MRTTWTYTCIALGGKRKPGRSKRSTTSVARRYGTPLHLFASTARKTMIAQRWLSSMRWTAKPRKLLSLSHAFILWLLSGAETVIALLSHRPSLWPLVDIEKWRTTIFRIEECLLGDLDYIQFKISFLCVVTLINFPHLNNPRFKNLFDCFNSFEYIHLKLFWKHFLFVVRLINFCFHML